MASSVSNAREVSTTHLELRSPMFGVTCISKCMFESAFVFSYYVVFPQRCGQKWNVRGLEFCSRATFWICALSGLKRCRQKVSIKPKKQSHFSCNGLPMQPFVVLASVFFCCPKGADPLLKTKNSREKHIFEGAVPHLELCSPMFGEKCISKFICDFQRI